MLSASSICISVTFRLRPRISVPEIRRHETPWIILEPVRSGTLKFTKNVSGIERNLMIYTKLMSALDFRFRRSIIMIYRVPSHVRWLMGKKWNWNVEKKEGGFWWGGSLTRWLFSCQTHHRSEIGETPAECWLMLRLVVALRWTLRSSESAFTFLWPWYDILIYVSLFLFIKTLRHRLSWGNKQSRILRHDGSV